MNVKNDILVSIILPVYNGQDFIEQCIKNILCQTFNRFELIIIDDGSTDNTSEIIQSIFDERIKVIYQTNQGVSVARNTGILNSKYEYIAFCDVDDFVTIDWLSSLTNEITDFDLICNSFFINDITNKVDVLNFCYFGDSEIQNWLYESFINFLKSMINSEVKSGVFGAMMNISLINNGPVTIIIDSKSKE